tara:strand:- start:9 stop:920 length:912 start_codon:yes stop_codon:yes gene_type:complete
MTSFSFLKPLGLFSVMIIILLTISCKEEEAVILQLSEYALLTTVSPENTGSISVIPGPYQEGTTVALEATSMENYVFKYWESDTIIWTTDSSAFMNPTTFIINFNTEVNAVFEYEDLDNDGVNDNVDNCLDTPANEAVDTLGCSTTALIGDFREGGIVIWVDDTGQHGLVCDLTDYAAIWGCNGTEIVGADSLTVGSGLQNTEDILAICQTAGIAARVANDLVAQEYSDWYLPSKEELKYIWLNSFIISERSIALGGGRLDAYYWTSSEYDADHAWCWDLKFGADDHSYSKETPARVRAIRTF